MSENIVQLQRELATVTEENERLRKDAERYRYLRDYGSTSHFMCRMIVTRYVGGGIIPVYQGRALDAVIDAERGGK